MRCFFVMPCRAVPCHACSKQPHLCSLSDADAVRAPAESPSYQLSVGDMELSSDEECMVPLPFVGAPVSAHAQSAQHVRAEARSHASSHRFARDPALRFVSVNQCRSLTLPRLLNPETVRSSRLARYLLYDEALVLHPGCDSRSDHVCCAAGAPAPASAGRGRARRAAGWGSLCRSFCASRTHRPAGQQCTYRPSATCSTYSPDACRYAQRVPLSPAQQHPDASSNAASDSSGSPCRC